MIDHIQQVIDRFLQLKVRSEDEVRSKLIVPISEVIGFGPEFRGENFPVFSFTGSKKNPDTFADFIFFDSPDFNDHAEYSYKNQKWIQDHCLLIIEAKKPGKIIDVPGQAQFYSNWTKALGYLYIDGDWIKGWMCNELCSDKEIIICKIENNTNYVSMLNFSFSKLSQIKRDAVRNNTSKKIFISKPSELKLPPKALKYIRRKMGRNAEGLDDLQLVSQYFKTCDFILNSKNRFDIPVFALDLPREILKAKLYSDKSIAPIDNGTVAHSYWQDVDRYQYISKVIRFDVYVEKQNISVIMKSLTAIDDSVKVRIERIHQILSFLSSGSVTISFDNIRPISFGIMNNPVKSSVDLLRDYKKCFENWLHGLEHMKTVEDYYQIVFDLSKVKNIEELYYNVALIFNGIKMIKNSVLKQQVNRNEYILIEYPEVLLENERIEGLEDVTILDFTFHPFKTTLIPGKYKVIEENDKKIVSLNICCEYKLLSDCL